MRSRPSSRTKRERILRRLDVDSEALDREPQIAPRLRANGVREKYLVDVLRCDTAAESMTFVQAWDKLTPNERDWAGIEAVAVSVGIMPRRLWELFQGALLVQSKEDLGVMIAMSLPVAMKATIRGATKAKGLSDREHLYKAARILPTPKGSTTIIQVPGQTEAEDLPEEANKGDLEPADAFLLNASKVMNPQKALPAVRALDEVEEVPDAHVDGE